MILVLRDVAGGGVKAHYCVAQSFGGVSDRMRLVGCVLVPLGVKRESLNGTNELAASGIDPKLFVTPWIEIFSQQSPPGDASVICGKHGRHAAGALHYLESASAAILATVPKVGRGNGVFNSAIGAH